MNQDVEIELPYEFQGQYYHESDVVIDQDRKVIKKGDIIYVKDAEMYHSGHILIADQDFDKSKTPTWGFKFLPNKYYRGICGRNEWIQSFAYPVIKINSLNPLFPTFCKVVKIEEDKVTVKSDQNKFFLIQYSSKIINGGVGHVIWGRTNNQKSDFASYQMAGYPINSIQI